MFKYLNRLIIISSFSFIFNSCKKTENEPAWLKQDLVAYYPFNGSVKDTSGNGYDGVIAGNVQPTTDRNGKTSSAFYFNGGAVSAPVNSTFFNKDFTVSIWAQTEEFTSPYPRLITAEGCMVLEFARDANPPRQINFYLSVPGSGAIAGYNVPINATNWNNIVIANSNGFSFFYLNGTFLGKSLTARPLSGTGTTSFIKFGNVALDIFHFKGKIDDVRIYKRALTETEVKYLYQN